MKVLTRPTRHCGWLLLLVAVSPSVAAEPGSPLLYRKLAVPESLVTTNKDVTFGGDVRIGVLTGDGRCDLLVFRNARTDSS